MNDKINKNAKQEFRLFQYTKDQLKDIAKEQNTSVSDLMRRLTEKLIDNKELLLSLLKDKKDNQDLISNFVDKTFQSYIDDIKTTKTNAQAIIYLRQSIKNDKFKGRYKRMDKSLNQFATNQGFTDIETVFYQDLSGYWSYEKVLGFLKADSVEAIYISEVTRLSRNIEAYLTIVNYAYKNHKAIYLNNTNIVEGTGYLSGLVQAIFAEMELLSKQTSFTHYMLEVAQFLNKTIKFEQITDKKAKKLASLAKFTDREQFITKMIDKAIEVINSDNKTNELKEVAKTVLKEFGIEEQ